MFGEPLLLCLAQIGLAFAGISSLLTIFQKRGRVWMLRDLIGMKFMLEHSIGLLVYAIQPFLWFYLFDSINALIKGSQFRLFDIQLASVMVSSFWLAVFNIWQVVKFFQRRKSISDVKERAAYEKPLLYVFLPITILIASILTVNTYIGLFGFYVLGLSWQLANGVIQFFVFIIVLTREEGIISSNLPVPVSNYKTVQSKLLRDSEESV